MITHILKSFIALFSEGIWLYYGFILMVKLQFGIVSPQHPPIWFLASLLGFGLCMIFRFKKMHDGFIYLLFALGGGILLYLLISQITEPSWKYRIASSFVILFVYFRGIYFALHVPDRHRMLLRLEGNMLFYFIYVLIGLGNPFTLHPIHLPFAISLLLSLIGMMLTLGEQRVNDNIQTRSVGDARPLVIPTVFLMGVTTVISLLLLLSSVQSVVSSVLNGMVGGIFSIGEGIQHGMNWLIQHLPHTEQSIPGLPPGPAMTKSPEGIAEVTSGVTLWPILTGALILIACIIFYFLVRKMKKLPLNLQGGPVRRQGSTTNTWEALKQLMIQLWMRLRSYIKTRKPVIFALPLYRNYDRFLRWGRKQGFPRAGYETPREYASRVTNQANLEEQAQREIKKLSDAFAASYYSGERIHSKDHFDHLMTELRK